MPKMGIWVSEGTILEWRKQPGDWVEADETIADVTTDKVDVEIPSPATGRLARAHRRGRRDGRRRRRRSPRSTPALEPGEAHPRRGHGRAPPQPTPRRGGDDRSGFISPVVRRIADKHGIDLEQVEGTGIGGRVRKKDVLAYVEAGGDGKPKAGRAALHSESPYKPDDTRSSRATADGDGDRREPMSPMRQAIAGTWSTAGAPSAHCTTIVEVDMSRVAARRAQLKERWRAAASR